MEKFNSYFQSTLLLMCISMFGLWSCTTSTKSTTNTFPYSVEFKVQVESEEDLQYFEDGIIPWISLTDTEKEAKRLLKKDEIILSENKAILVIDYPLSNPAEISIQSATNKGFTRKELALIISKQYKNIYAEEETSATIKTIPLNERTGLINRNQTNGKYGIWGHDLSDLDLSDVTFSKQENGIIIIELGIES